MDHCGAVRNCDIALELLVECELSDSASAIATEKGARRRRAQTAPPVSKRSGAGTIEPGAPSIRTDWQIATRLPSLGGRLLSSRRRCCGAHFELPEPCTSFRLRAKRFRYTLELFEGFYGSEMAAAGEVLERRTRPPGSDQRLRHHHRSSRRRPQRGSRHPKAAESAHQRVPTLLAQRLYSAEASLVAKLAREAHRRRRAVASKQLKLFHPVAQHIAANAEQRRGLGLVPARFLQAPAQSNCALSSSGKDPAGERACAGVGRSSVAARLEAN